MRIEDRPTPETEHAAFRSQYGDHVPTAFARSLEQQRDHAIEALIGLLLDGLERQCDECGGNAEDCPSIGCAIYTGRQALRDIEAARKKGPL